MEFEVLLHPLLAATCRALALRCRPSRRTPRFDSFSRCGAVVEPKSVKMHMSSHAIYAPARLDDPLASPTPAAARLPMLPLRPSPCAGRWLPESCRGDPFRRTPIAAPWGREPCRANRHPAVRRTKHSVAQIVWVALPGSPAHRRLLRGGIL